MFYRSKLVELRMPASLANGDQYEFENDSDLQNCYIIAVEAYDAASLTLAPSGAPVQSSLLGATLTLTEMSAKERIRDQPMSDLQPANQSGFIRFFYPFKLNWQNSYIKINDASAVAISESFVFTVHYVPISEYDQYLELYEEFSK